jgi:hypothetical protein
MQKVYHFTRNAVKMNIQLLQQCQIQRGIETCLKFSKSQIQLWSRAASPWRHLPSKTVARGATLQNLDLLKFISRRSLMCSYWTFCLRSGYETRNQIHHVFPSHHRNYVRLQLSLNHTHSDSYPRDISDRNDPAYGNRHS